MVPKYTKNGGPKAAPDDLGPDNFPTESRHRPGDPQGVPKWSQKGAKRVPKGCQKGAPREPKGSPNPTKIDPKWSQKPRAHRKPRKASRRRGKTQKISRGDPKYIKIVTKCNENEAKWEHEGHKREGDVERRSRETPKDAERRTVMTQWGTERRRET